MLPNWREMASCDSILTENLFHFETQKMHRIIVESPSKEKKNMKKTMTFKKLEEAYEKRFSKEEINCLDIRRSTDQNYSGIRLFAEKQLQTGQLKDGSGEFLTFFPSIDIKIGINDFSDISTSKSSFLMLIPASFINPSFRPNCIHVSCLKSGSVKIEVIDANGIAPSEQIFVKYGGSFFGSNNEDSMYPHTEFHSDRVAV